MQDTLKTLVLLWEVPDIGLIIGWIFSLYMVIGATIKLNRSDLKKGLLATLVLMLSQEIIRFAVFDHFQYLSPNYSTVVVTTMLVLLGAIGMGIGKFIYDRVQAYERKLS